MKHLEYLGLGEPGGSLSQCAQLQQARAPGW